MHHFISFILRIAYAGAFGFILVWHTADIVKYIPQLLGGLLMLECVAQLLELFYLKAKTVVSVGFFVVPVLILLYGLFLIFCCEMLDNLNDFMTSISTLVKLKIELKLGGVSFLAFVLSELVISIYFFKPLYRAEKFAEERRQQLEAQKALEAERARQAAQAAAEKADEREAQAENVQN